MSSPPEDREVVLREAHEARKIVDGSGVANSSLKSHAPRGSEGVDDLVHELAGFALELRHALGENCGSSRRRYFR